VGITPDRVTAIERLTLGDPQAVVIGSPHAAVDAADRIRRAIDQRSSVEIDEGNRPARLLGGELRDFDVTLHLQVEGLSYRHNRSWAIELRGMIVPTPEGSELQGTIRVGSAPVLWFLWIWRIGVAAFGLIGIVAAVAGTPGGLVFVVVAAGMVAASVWLDREGTRIAREDAHGLVAFLSALLGKTDRS
jgi:hypothetical protein